MKIWLGLALLSPLLAHGAETGIRRRQQVARSIGQRAVKVEDHAARRLQHPAILRYRQPLGGIAAPA